LLLQGMKAKALRLILALFLCPHAFAADAEKPFLHPLFSDHAVLQGGEHVRIWGWTKPGAGVEVQFGEHRAKSKGKADGRWEVSVDTPPIGGPYELKVTGNETVTRKDLLVGDVWLCSGQSNMEWPVSQSNDARLEIPKARHTNIRLLAVPKLVSGAPVTLTDVSWQKCSPQTVVDFSAVGYFFGRSLQEHDPKIPIGLIDSSWGGTIAEAWTSGEALDDLPDFREDVKSVKQLASVDYKGTPEEREASFQAKLAAWWEENDPGNGAWAAPNHDASAWKVMEVPGLWHDGILPGFDGIVWFRKIVTLPNGWSDKVLELSLGAIDDADITFVNGQEIGSMSGWNQERRYSVAAKHWQPGDNLIAVRVLDNSGGGGFHGEPKGLSLRPVNEKNSNPVSLAGVWEYQESKPLDRMSPQPTRIGNNPNVATVLNNGMIAPLLPYNIKGAIWYQGESNAGRPTQYRTLLPTMIEDWRRQFQVGDFPFHIVQLANFMARDDEPQESNWAALREAQALTAQHDPNTGIAVTIDIGEADDIHPRNKQDVGKRLAMAQFGQSGPVYREMKVEGNAVRILFDHVRSGLISKGALKGFAISGADKQFAWADAKIDGHDVIVSASQIKEPVAVRYGWGNNPVCTLYNKLELPAIPFRTDIESAEVANGYTNLFDGKTLRGWHQINGSAVYQVKDGTITGTTAKGSPNSFLCSEKRYGDFELQFEVKLIDGELNSGCQIRSNSYPHYQDHRVHGYQVEIATNGTSGFIYDEARRGWLSKDRSDAAAKAAFKNDGWNHYRILCVGDRLKTWVNHVPVADVTDAMTAKGFIGLQVHGVGGDPKWQVAWRNIWIREIESDRGKQIFNGKDLTGWTSKPGGWAAKNDETLARMKKGAGYIWSEDTYEDFVLDLEFKTAAKCNSGVFIRTDPKKGVVQNGFEIQIFDSHGKDKPGKHDCGALYDALAPRINVAKPAGEWNHLVVKAQGPHINIVLNGEEVVSADLDHWNTPRKNPDGSKNKFKTALKDLPRTGLIGFQDHGAPVWFRNVFVKRLN
jgi:sialate O-acetylesterase